MHHPESVVAKAYAAAVRDLGVHIATRLVLKLESTHALADLDKITIVFLEVLTK